MTIWSSSYPVMLCMKTCDLWPHESSSKWQRECNKISAKCCSTSKKQSPRYCYKHGKCNRNKQNIEATSLGCGIWIKPYSCTNQDVILRNSCNWKMDYAFGIRCACSHLLLIHPSCHSMTSWHFTLFLRKPGCFHSQPESACDTTWHKHWHSEGLPETTNSIAIWLLRILIFHSGHLKFHEMVGWLCWV